MNALALIFGPGSVLAYFAWRRSWLPMPGWSAVILAGASIAVMALWITLRFRRNARPWTVENLAASWPLWLGLVWTRELAGHFPLWDLLMLSGFSVASSLRVAAGCQPVCARIPGGLIPVLSALFALLFAVVFAVQPWMKYTSFYTYWMDFGYMIHPIWNTAHGRILEYATLDGRFASSLGDHFSLIFLPVALVFRLIPDPLTLYAIQSIAGASGGLLLFRLVLASGGSRLEALAFQTAFYLYAPLQFGMISDFHADPLTVPFVMLMLLGFQTRRFGPLVAGFVCALVCKEHIGLVLAPLVLVLAYLHRPWRGRLILLAVAGCVYSLVVILALIPYFNQGRESYSLEVLYPGGYAGLGGILGAMVAHPWQSLLRLLSAHNAEQLVWLLLPLLFAPVAALPEILSIGLMLLKECYGIFAVHNHHQAYMAPLLFWCVLRIAARLPEARRMRLVLSVCLCCGLVGAVSGESPLSLRFWRSLQQRYVATAHDRVLARAVAGIPPRASVSTDAHAAVHLYQRRDLYLFPQPIPRDSAEYVMVDRKRLGESGMEIRVVTWNCRTRAQVLAQFDSLQACQSYTTVFDEDSVVVLRRRQGDGR